MNKEPEQLEALQDIRRMMKESSRFLSLSGLSGILAGIYALTGAYLGHLAIFHFDLGDPGGPENSSQDYNNLLFRLVSICIGVLTLSIATGLYLSAKKARLSNHKLFDYSSRRLLWSMFIPLFSGGIFCVGLVLHGGDYILLISPSMLIFYGLGLIGSSRLTLHDIKYLGYLEVALGLIGCFYQGHGLLFWSLGFGVLHIIYGSIMWYKYDRNLSH